MLVWIPDLRKPVYGPECPVFEWSARSCGFNILIPDNHAVQYTDESGIQVSGIQMVTAFGCLLSRMNENSLPLELCEERKSEFLRDFGWLFDLRHPGKKVNYFWMFLFVVVGSPPRTHSIMKRSMDDLTFNWKLNKYIRHYQTFISPLTEWMWPFSYQTTC